MYLDQEGVAGESTFNDLLSAAKRLTLQNERDRRFLTGKYTLQSDIPGYGVRGDVLVLSIPSRQSSDFEGKALADSIFQIERDDAQGHVGLKSKVVSVKKVAIDRDGNSNFQDCRPIVDFSFDVPKIGNRDFAREIQEKLDGFSDDFRAALDIDMKNKLRFSEECLKVIHDAQVNGLNLSEKDVDNAVLQFAKENEIPFQDLKFCTNKLKEIKVRNGLSLNNPIEDERPEIVSEFYESIRPYSVRSACKDMKKKVESVNSESLDGKIKGLLTEIGEREDYIRDSKDAIKEIVGNGILFFIVKNVFEAGIEVATVFQKVRNFDLKVKSFVAKIDNKVRSVQNVLQKYSKTKPSLIQKRMQLMENQLLKDLDDHRNNSSNLRKVFGQAINPRNKKLEYMLNVKEYRGMEDKDALKDDLKSKLNDLKAKRDSFMAKKDQNLGIKRVQTRKDLLSKMIENHRVQLEYLAKAGYENVRKARVHEEKINKYMSEIKSLQQQEKDIVHNVKSKALIEKVDKQISFYENMLESVHLEDKRIELEGNVALNDRNLQQDLVSKINQGLNGNQPLTSSASRNAMFTDFNKNRESESLDKKNESEKGDLDANKAENKNLNKKDLQKDSVATDLNKGSDNNLESKKDESVEKSKELSGNDMGHSKDKSLNANPESGEVESLKLENDAKTKEKEEDKSQKEDIESIRSSFNDILKINQVVASISSNQSQAQDIAQSQQALGLQNQSQNQAQTVL